MSRHAETEALLQNNVDADALLSKRLRSMDRQVCYEAVDPSRYLRDELKKVESMEQEPSEQ